MTEKQAIKILQEEKSWESDYRKIDAFIMGIEALEKVQEFEAIGTIEEFKALKEKSVAKKPIKINIPNTSWCRKQERYECPSCHKYLNFRELSYCCVCGQKLDWQRKEKVWLDL